MDSTAAGVNVTAAVNTAGNGLTITDDNATPTGNLAVAEVGVGTTASELGLAANRPGAIEADRGRKPRQVRTPCGEESQANGGCRVW